MTCPHSPNRKSFHGYSAFWIVGQAPPLVGRKIARPSSVTPLGEPQAYRAEWEHVVAETLKSSISFSVRQKDLLEQTHSNATRAAQGMSMQSVPLFSHDLLVLCDKLLVGV